MLLYRRSRRPAASGIQGVPNRLEEVRAALRARLKDDELQCPAQRMAQQRLMASSALGGKVPSADARRAGTGHGSRQIGAATRRRNDHAQQGPWHVEGPEAHCIKHENAARRASRTARNCLEAPPELPESAQNCPE
eukprot:9031285-Alexandrium_andersonii.AAC.1